MEIFGGFMVMMSFIALFLAVVWLIMPFVVFAIKGKQDRTLEVLEGIDKRLAVIEARLRTLEPADNKLENPPLEPSEELPKANTTPAPVSTATSAENI